MKKKGIEALAHEAARMLKSGADVDALSDRFCNKTTRALVTAGAFLYPKLTILADTAFNSSSSRLRITT